VIYGNARVTKGAAVPLLQRLAPFTLGRRRSIHLPPCGTSRAMSRESPRHVSPGFVRGFKKPPFGPEGKVQTRKAVKFEYCFQLSTV
jgi:hypothetical protein